MHCEPLVSVILPTYNRSELVVRAVRSVLEQSYRNLELLVVDDGSSDATGEVLAPFSCDPRFHYIYQENRGQAAARNLAIKCSNGYYIAFLDSDNYWDVDKLKSQLAFWRGKDEYDILYSGVIYVDAKGERLPRGDIARPTGIILDKLLLSNFVTNNTALVPKRCFSDVGFFNESLRIAEDYDLWLRFATRFTFLYHPEQVTFYSCKGERLSSQEERNIEINFQILNTFFETYPELVTRRLKRKALGNLLIWQIESRWNNGMKPTLSDIVRSIRSNPCRRQVWKHLAKYLLK